MTKRGREWPIFKKIESSKTDVKSVSQSCLLMYYTSTSTYETSLSQRKRYLERQRPIISRGK